MNPVVESALKLMRWALAMLDQEGFGLAAARLQSAIDTAERETQADPPR